MANRGHGWLYITEDNGAIGELVNHARTSAYLETSAALGCGTVYNVLDDGGCPSYRWTPNTDGTWTQKTYTTPALDGAPWYNPKYPESAQALGFWITEWTGLDSGHVKRTSSPVGAYRGGSVLGISSNAGRVMGIEMLMIAESERAMEYLYQWFDSAISSVCSTCETDTIMVRRFCDTIVTSADATDGVVEVRGVGLVSGMVYGEDPVEKAGCFLRRVNFTLEATDPCMYSPCTGEVIDQYMDWSDCFTSGAASPSRPKCRPECAEIPVSCRAVYDYTIDTPSASAPVLTLEVPQAITNGGGTQTSTIPLRIRTYANPYGFTGAQLCGLPLLAELYVASLPASSELKYDMAGRKVEFRDATSGTWVNGFAFVEANTVGVPRFPALGCGVFTTVIEPSNFCVTTTTPAAEGTFLANAVVNSMAFHPDPSIGTLIGGGFSTLGASARVSLGAITAGGRVQPFNPVLTSLSSAFVYQIIVQSDNKILIAGSFDTCNGVTVNSIVRLLPNGTIDPSWDLTTGAPGIDVAQAIFGMKQQADGKILITGTFTTCRGVTVNRVARLNSNGTLDTTWGQTGTVGVDAQCFDLAIQTDGKIILAGQFVTAKGVTQNGICRFLGTDGTLDTTFNTGGTIGVSVTPVRAVVIQANGKMVIGGAFTTARGTTVNRIARLNTDGTIDATFNTGGTVGMASGFVETLVLDKTERIIASGTFLAARGTTVNGIVRLSALGAIDPAWDLTGTVGITASQYAEEILFDSAGRILIGGTFTTARGVTKNRVARLLSNGALDTNFPNTIVYYPSQMVPSSSMAVQERIGCV